MATEMYANGADIIFHAAGQAGVGVFDAARNLLIEDPDREIWVIGADVDQTAEGEFTIEDRDYSITLTSTLKRVNNVIQEFTQQTYEGNFSAGMIEYGMEEEAVDISAGQLSGETYDIVADYREQLQNDTLNIDDLINIP